MDKEHQRRFALIIANNEYHDADFQKLIAPAQDAKALASVLKDPAIGDFEVKVILNEPSYKVNEEIEAFFVEMISHFPKQKSTFQLDKMVVVNDGLAFITWHAKTPSLDVSLGSDTFIIKDGKIYQQTFVGQLNYIN